MSETSESVFVKIRYEVPQLSEGVETWARSFSEEEVRKGNRIRLDIMNGWLHVFQSEGWGDTVSHELVFLVPEGRIICIKCGGGVKVG